MELCKRTSTQHIDYDRFARLTEGYSVADLVDLIDRAMFYAHRNREFYSNLRSHIPAK